jgi:hypothetical protein
MLLQTGSTAVQPSPIPPGLIYVHSKTIYIFGNGISCSKGGFCVALHLLLHNFALVYPDPCSTQVKPFVFYRHYMRSCILQTLYAVTLLQWMTPMQDIYKISVICSRLCHSLLHHSKMAVSNFNGPRPNHHQDYDSYAAQKLLLVLII